MNEVIFPKSRLLPKDGPQNHRISAMQHPWPLLAVRTPVARIRKDHLYVTPQQGMALRDVVDGGCRCDGAVHQARFSIHTSIGFHTEVRLYFNDVHDEIDRMELPIAVVLHGTVLGAGLELAMSARYCVALSGTMLGLPEVKLGIVPGAGGTQRLLRLVGVRPALDMMTRAHPIGSVEALKLGLIDAEVDDTLMAAAPASAQSVSRSVCHGGGSAIPTSIKRGFLSSFSIPIAVHCPLWTRDLLVLVQRRTLAYFAEPCRRNGFSFWPQFLN